MPPAIRNQVSSVPTWAGEERHVVSPLPSWPLLLSPQANRPWTLTVAVLAELALALPALLVAVTVTCMVLPTSAPTNV